ncbi:putative family carbohydrate kinase protein [Eutypa lata UCREL1]|uniref:Putative family carbohydrate kinase protein n=1 Tax=Eutypa lata (strain UCR-EL1) TaxID=1287681 RepID=M7T1T6_EUTLA|nr:putative family carbohydrate kinase protein [Eutypa lata UCREL1]
MPDRPSTRGLLQYTDSDFGRKTFAYLTQPLQPYPSILQYPHLIGSKVFHFLAKPDDTEKQAQAVLEARRPLGLHERPRIIWEPAPLSCEFENRDAHLRACRFVDVFSPNHIELRKIMQPEYGRDCQIVTDFDRKAVMHGTVSASFAMEQIGLPTQGEFDEHETWNGVQVAERLDEYRKRLEVLDTLS